MMRSVALMLLLVSAVASAADPDCVCVAGCKVASDPLPSGPQYTTPTGCAIYKMPGRVPIGTATLVAADSVAGGIAANNALVCVPSVNYTYGPAGSKACLATIPAQPAGTTVTVVMATTDGTKESADSVAHSFRSVSVLPGPPLPVVHGVTP